MCTGFKNTLCYVVVFENWKIKYMYCICAVYMCDWYNRALWFIAQKVKCASLIFRAHRRVYDGRASTLHAQHCISSHVSQDGLSSNL